jgi:hypothetical protein
MTYARQWRRCDSDGSACVDIAGATGKQYTATGDDIGHALRVRVDASNGAGDASAESGATAAVTALAPAAGGSDPAIDDTTPTIGQTLNVSDGSWTGSQPLDMSYQWRRCATTDPSTCTDIPLQTASAYTVTSDDAGKRLRVMVTASNAGGSASRDTAPTEAVATTATIKAPLNAKLRAALAGKVGVTVDCTAACAVVARFSLAPALARKLGVPKVPARGSGQLAGAGRISVKLVFSAKARKKLRNVRKLVGSLVVETRDAGGTLIAARHSKLTLRG